MPLFFLLIGYGILLLLVSPYIRPMVSLYGMISQDQIPTFTKNQTIIHGEETESDTMIRDFSQFREGVTYGRVSIPAVNIDVPLLYGSSDETLYYGVGQRLKSDKPGFGKPVMIAGHTIPYFKNLGNIQIGDVIHINTFYGDYEYQVSGTAVANEADTSAYDLTQSKEQLILFTCYPLDGIGKKEDRLFVYADKISGPEMAGDEND